MYLNALGQPILVFNSLKAAAELLDRRAYISSDRPRLIVANEILCGNLFTAFTYYGDVLVFIFLLKRRDSVFPLLVGVAPAARHMKCSQRSRFVIITQPSAKRQSFWPLQSSRTQRLWTSISSAPPPPLPWLFYTIILPLKTNMIRPLRKSMDLSIVCRRRLLLEQI